MFFDKFYLPPAAPIYKKRHRPYKTDIAASYGLLQHEKKRSYDLFHIICPPLRNGRYNSDQNFRSHRPSSRQAGR